jgi:hypothetical protein
MLIPDRTDYAVFEGSFDFLAALAHHGTDQPRSNVLVLNSLSFVERAHEALKGRAATRLFMYLDNDQAGQDALRRCVLGGSRHVLGVPRGQGYERIS